MRTYQITVNGQEYTVEIDDPNASPASVRVNGRAFRVTLAERLPTGQVVASPPSDIEPEEAYVPVVTTTYVETVTETEPEASRPTGPSPGAAEGTETIIAPMPGKIMDIVVKAGDRVKQGDTLCSLEAMKMKSPIRTTVDGIVARILISEGQNVNYGDVLFTLR